MDPFGGFGNIFGRAFQSIFNGFMNHFDSGFMNPFDSGFMNPFDSGFMNLFASGFPQQQRYCPPQPQPNPSSPPDDKESTKTNKENPKKRGRPRNKPILDDEAPVKKSMYMASRKPQANSFAFQSISCVGGNRSANIFCVGNGNNAVTINSNNVVTYNGGDFSCVGSGNVTYNSNSVVAYNGFNVGTRNLTINSNNNVNYYVGGNGASCITSRITGSNGYTYEEFKEADSSTRRATHRVNRGIRNKAHSVTRKLKSDGHVDTLETLHNLNQDEVPDFEEEWTENAEEHLPQWSSKVSGNRIDISVNATKPKQSKRRYKKK